MFPGKDPCPAGEGLTYEMDVDLCYLLTLTYYAGWDTAEAACQHRDMRLAILDTDDKIDVVRSVILNNSGTLKDTCKGYARKYL